MHVVGGLSRLGVGFACVAVLANAGIGCGQNDVAAVGPVGVQHPPAQQPPPPPPPPPAAPITADLFGVWSVARTDVFAVGAAGTLLRYDGAWHAEASPTTQNLLSVWATTGGEAWAVGGGGTIVRRHAGAWTVVASPVADDLRAVWAAAIDDAWAVSATGAILHFDGGAWSISFQEATSIFSAVWGASANDVWVGGAGFEPDEDRASVLMHWDGSTWTKSFVCQAEGNRFAAGGWAAQIRDLSGTSASDIWGAGYCYPGGGLRVVGHVIHRSGAGWTENPGLTSELLDFRTLDAIWSSGPADVWAGTPFADDGDPSAPVPTMLHFDGYVWTRSTDPSTVAIRDIGGTAADDVWAVGNGGKRLHFDGIRWTPSP